jgi:Cytochrome C'
MTRPPFLALLAPAACVLALAGCRKADPSAPVPTRAPPPAAAAVAPAPAPALDPRKPVPLTAMMATHQKAEMRDHLRVVQEIAVALGKDDFDGVATAAARIGWSEQEAMMCRHMGAGAPGFADLGEHFHKTADGIADAARRHDRAAVTTALAATLATCVGCHDAYRQEIVDGPTFEKLTAAAGMHLPMRAGSGSAAGMPADCPMMHGK